MTVYLIVDLRYLIKEINLELLDKVMGTNWA